MAAPFPVAAAADTLPVTVLDADCGVAQTNVQLRTLPATVTALARPIGVVRSYRPRFHPRDARLLLERGGLATWRSPSAALIAVRAGAILLAARGLPPAVVTTTRCVLLGPTPGALQSALSDAVGNGAGDDAPPFELAALEALLTAALAHLAAERRALRPLLELVGGAADAEGLGDPTSRRRVAAIDIGVPALTDSIHAAKARLRRLQRAAASLSAELSRLLDDPADMAGLLLSMDAAEAATSGGAGGAGGDSALPRAATTSLWRRRLAQSASAGFVDAPPPSAVGTPDPRDDVNVDGDGGVSNEDDASPVTASERVGGKPRGRRRYGRRHHPGAVRAEAELRRRAVTDVRHLAATDAAEVMLEAALAQADAQADGLQRALDDLDVAEAHAGLLSAAAQGRLWSARVLLSALAVAMALPIALSGLLSMNLGSQAPPPSAHGGSGGSSGWLSRDAAMFTAVSTAQVALAGVLLAAGVLTVRRRLRAVEATPGWSVATTGAQIE